MVRPARLELTTPGFEVLLLMVYPVFLGVNSCRWVCQYRTNWVQLEFSWCAVLL